jgi:hypothetical protein
MDYAYQYVRATRTSRITSSQFDFASGQLTASLTRKTDLDTSVQVFNGNDALITNLVGSVPAFTGSVAITLATLPVAPIILVPPLGRTNRLAENANLTVIAGGSAPLAFQWLRNGASLSDGGNLFGVATDTLTWTNLTPSNSGLYQVVITNVLGNATSPTAPLVVATPPNLNGITLLPDRNIQLSLSALSNLTYRIDASTNLIDWAGVTNLSNPNCTFQFIDFAATNFHRRFYRSLWVP